MEKQTRSDAFVFFGATGDLAYKKIFPAMQAMVKRGSLDVPLIGVAKAGWNLEQFKARALDSLEKHGGADRQRAPVFAAAAHYLAIPPAMFETVAEHQFLGYRDEKGVAPTSKTETFAALKLEVNSWRRQGVPFYLRAGKQLPVTCTEIVSRLRKPPAIFPADGIASNYLRMRISPDVAIAMDVTVMVGGEARIITESVEMVASSQPTAEQMDAYDKVLGDTLVGDATLFAREDYLEEAWRIVDTLLSGGTPLHFYEPQTWGPAAVDHLAPAGGWHDPVAGQER